MTVELLTEHHLEFLSLKGGCTGSSESTLVKIPHCWKSHVAAHFSMNHHDTVEFHRALEPQFHNPIINRSFRFVQAPPKPHYSLLDGEI